jgi:hypothetical protein
MPVDVAASSSNAQDMIANAAKVIGRSVDCKKVFSAIYKGKRKIKTANEIVQLTKLKRVRVLQEAGKLTDSNIAGKTKVDGETAYEKFPFYYRNKKKILQLAGNKKALDKFPTKSNPRMGNIEVTIANIPKQMVNIQKITVDDIDSFSKVKEIPLDQKPLPLDEKKFKEGIQRVIGENGTFQDWGGETDDLFTPRLVIKGERKDVSFGLKGKGQSGILTPKKMGARGDQIQRLFRAPAEVFIVQYWDQIDASIIEQMKSFAIAKSALEAKKIIYGIIDGQDTIRLIKAYPECFPTGTV